MYDWRKVLIPPTATIQQAMETIDRESLRISLVVDENNLLLGTVTDGDIRRGILRHSNLETPVSEIMNRQPKTARLEDSREHIISMMEQGHHIIVPVIDSQGQVVGVETLHELIKRKRYDNWVILMAGGLGTRLRPLTNDCPKPLLQIGGKPLLETILEQFIENGFYNFYFAINYKGDMVKDYFGDGGKWGVNIRYLEEDKRMGTAGALSLLPDTPEKPFFVMNGDLLTKLNFNHLLDFHDEHDAVATMCVRTYEQTVPYGVVEIDGHKLTNIHEKPTQSFFVNAGIYVLDPDVLDHIPNDKFYDMTELVEGMIEKGSHAAVFPIREYWLDIGRMEDFESAHMDYQELFL
ncbi:MAG: CBS domain-containing protein [Gammaproteobacteria bacterium]|nr:CBS domain-containing protein [Gammaproteobacteria bacterium]